MNSLADVLEFDRSITEGCFRDDVLPFQHLIPMGKAWDAKRLAEEIAAVYDVVNGDERTRAIYNHLLTAHPDMVAGRLGVGLYIGLRP